MASLYDRLSIPQIAQLESLWGDMEAHFESIAIDEGQSELLGKLECVRIEADCDLHTAYRLIALEEQLAEQKKQIDMMLALIDRYVRP